MLESITIFSSLILNFLLCLSNQKIKSKTEKIKTENLELKEEVKYLKLVNKTLSDGLDALKTKNQKQ